MTNLKRLFFIIYVFILFFIGDIIFSKVIIDGNEQEQKKVRIFNPYYHHGFKENIKQNLSWSANFYKICTDHNTFLINCEKYNDKKKNIDKNEYDILFIGDSITEGLGYSYEETFPGQIEKLSEKRIANLAVLSYSPFLYYKKIQFFLEKKIKFKHLFVFIDPSDIQDDQNYLNLKNITNEKFFFENERDKKAVKNISDYLNSFDGNFRNFFSKNFLISYFIFKKLKIFYYDNFTKDQDLYFDKITWMDYNNSRVSWSYDSTFQGYSENGIDDEIKFSVSNMTKLSHLLELNGIDLSVGVYPLPQNLRYEKNYSRYVQTWKNFCLKKCKNFIDFYPLFKKEKNFYETYKKYYIFNDVHFNKFSHKMIGKFLNDNINF